MKPKNKLKFSSISDGMKSCKLCLLMKNIWITKKTKLWNKCSISWTGRKNLLPNGSIWMLRIFSSPMKLPTNWQKDCGKEHQLRSCTKVIRWNRVLKIRMYHKIISQSLKSQIFNNKISYRNIWTKTVGLCNEWSIYDVQSVPFSTLLKHFVMEEWEIGNLLWIYKFVWPTIPMLNLHIFQTATIFPIWDA